MQFVLKTVCFAGVGCGNLFPLASVGYGKVAFPRGKPVFAQAGKRASRTGTHSCWQAWGTGRSFPHGRPVSAQAFGEACFPYGNPFPLASVGYGKVPFLYRSPVSAQAWGTGSMLPVRDPIPVGKRGLREGCLPVREPCFCTGVVFGKVTPFGVLKL